MFVFLSHSCLGVQCCSWWLDSLVITIVTICVYPFALCFSRARDYLNYFFILFLYGPSTSLTRIQNKFRNLTMTSHNKWFSNRVILYTLPKPTFLDQVNSLNPGELTFNDYIKLAWAFNMTLEVQRAFTFHMMPNELLSFQESKMNRK